MNLSFRRESKLAARRKKSIFRLAWIFAAFVFVSVLLVVAFHANDSRLPDALSPRREASLKRRGVLVQSVLRGSVPVTQSVDPVVCRERSGIAAASYMASPAVRMTTSSERFVTACQVSLSLGIYPGRVEMRDGIFVPPGESLQLKIPGQDGLLRFGMAVVDGGERWESADHASPSGQAISGGGRDFRLLDRFFRKWAVFAPQSFLKFAKWMFQYVHPAAAIDGLTGEAWKDFEVPLSGRDSLGERHSYDWTLRCRSDVPCIFSDVEFVPAVGSGAEPSSEPENFVLVVVDTLRGDALLPPLAPAGFSDFAARSATFTRALAPGNMTSPSTNALLGCRTPTELKSIAFAYAVGEEARQEYYRSRTGSFPAGLTAAGYRTAMIGNISVVSEVIGVGVHHGFQENMSFEGEGYELSLIHI